MGTLLEVKNLKKYFATPAGQLHAVDDVSFSIEQGQNLGLVGESGCGKSTLGRTIIRLINPTAGQIIFKGQDITQLKKKQLKALRKQMQIVFQDPFSSIDPRMTVGQTIEEPLRIYREFHHEADYDKRVRELMDTVGLAARYRNSYPHELDGGRRQRIGIARALAVNPEFIVCDEPVSALDVSIQAQILNLLQDLQVEKKLTYIFITHDLSVVKHVSDDICVMYLGVMVEKSPAKQLFQHQYHPYTQALISAIPQPRIDITTKRILLEGEITSPINLGPGCRFAPRCPYATEQCRTVTPQLQDMGDNRFVACHKPQVP